MDHHLFLQIIL